MLSEVQLKFVDFVQCADRSTWSSWLDQKLAATGRSLGAIADATGLTKMTLTAVRDRKTTPELRRSVHRPSRDAITCSPACREKAYRRRRRQLERRRVFRTKQGCHLCSDRRANRVIAERAGTR